MSEQVKISELTQADTPLDPNGLFEFALGGSSFKASLQDIIDEGSEGTLDTLVIDTDKDWLNFSITNMDTLALNIVEFATDTTIKRVGSNLQLQVATTTDEISFLHGNDNEFVFKGGPNGTSVWNENDMQQMGKLSFGLIPEIAFIEDGGTSLDLQLRAGTTVNDGTISLFLDQSGVDYIFSDTQADFKNNELINTVTTSSVTGISGITGLGIQVQDIVMSGTNAIIFPDANWKILDRAPSASVLFFETTGGLPGTITFQNNDHIFSLQLTSDIGFLIKEITGSSTNPALLIDTEILVASDTGDKPIIILKADRVGVGIIQNRPLFQIQNLNTPEWLLDNDGTVTQFGDLDMSNNDILNVNTLSNLTTLTVTGTATVGFLQIDPPTDAAVPTITTTFTEVTAGTPPTEIFTMIFKGQDNVPNEEPYVIIDVQQETLTENLIQGSIDFSVASASISTALVSLLKLDGKNPQDVPLDPLNRKFGRLIAGADLQIGLFELQFDDEFHFIHQHGVNLELHANTNQQIRMVIGDPTSGFSYQFGTNRANWGNLGITAMGAISFSTPLSASALNVSIQRGSIAFGGSTNDLQLDAGNTGQIVLRIFDGASTDVEEYNFGDGAADFHFNDILMRNWTISALSGDEIIRMSTTANTDATLEIGPSSSRNIAIGGQETTSTFTTEIESEIEGANSQMLITVTGDTASNTSSVGPVFEFFASFTEATAYTGRPILGIQNAGNQLWLLDNDGTVTQSGDLDMDDNNLVNMGILEFSNTNNRLTDSGGGSELKIQGEEKIQLGIQSAPTALFSFTDNTFDWDSEIGTIPIFTVTHTESAVTTEKDIFQFIFKGQDNELASLTYAEIVVRQTERTPDEEDGSIAFNIIQDGSLLPLMILNGEDGRLELEKDIGITFTDNATTGTLLLETNTSDNLLFNLKRVKTGNTVITEVSVGPTDVGTTETDITAVPFQVANQPQGIGIVTLTLLVSPTSNNHQATFRIKQNNVTIFEKSVRVGDNGEENNPITFVTDTVLDGTILKATAQGATGSFKVEASSELSIIQLF